SVRAQIELVAPRSEGVTASAVLDRVGDRDRVARVCRSRTVRERERRCGGHLQVRGSDGKEAVEDDGVVVFAVEGGRDEVAFGELVAGVELDDDVVVAAGGAG